MSIKNLLKHQNKFEKEYTAIVTSNEDPLGRGRLQVRIDAILGDIPFWVNATLVAGSVKLLLIPNTNDVVSVKFRNKDIYSGEWELKGSPINGTKEQSIDPNKYGFSDNQGNCIIIDRATNSINLTSMQNFTIKAGGNCIINIEGSADITATSCDIHAEQVNLGDGGQPIARLGDEVTVIDENAQYGGTWKGTITKAGKNTSI